MAIEEKNALELIDSYTVTPGDTEAYLTGMNTFDAYLLVYTNLADSDDGASLTTRPTYNGNDGSNLGEAYGAGRQNVNGTNTNQSFINAQPYLVNYGTTGSQYETCGHAYIFPNNDQKSGKRAMSQLISKAITYNDTNLVTHDLYFEWANSYFQANGIKLYPNSGAWDSGEFKLYKLRSGN